MRRQRQRRRQESGLVRQSGRKFFPKVRGYQAARMAAFFLARTGSRDAVLWPLFLHAPRAHSASGARPKPVTFVTLTCAAKHCPRFQPGDTVGQRGATRPRRSPRKVTVLCEAHHGDCQASAPNCVISQTSLWELSQTGEGPATAQNQPPEKHLVSASWKPGFGPAAKRSGYRRALIKG